MSSNQPKKRLKAAESRRALLDAGLELLTLRGVAPGLDRVTLKDAIELSGVPRSTAYRLYEGGKGQLEEYRHDLLSDLDNGMATVPLQADVDDVLAQVAPLIESQDPTKLAAGLREVVRVIVNSTVASVAASLEWRVYMSSLASVGTGIDSDPSGAEAFQVAAQRFDARFVDLFGQLGSTFGLQPRSPLSLQEFGALVGATIEGTALRQHVEPQLADITRRTATDAELQSWSAASLAVEALLVCWFEADPNAGVSANLASWTSWS